MWAPSDAGRTAATARMTPRRRRGFQVDNEEKDPDALADEAVVARVKVPLTVAVVPDELPEKVKVADPEPPATSLS